MTLGSSYYHVIVQGINKEYIFKNDLFIKKYKELIIQKKKDCNIVILAYCIMHNHAHFLIYSDKSEYLAKYMQRLNTSYSQYYNKQLKRVGYVFRNRYYSQAIFNEKQLYNCLTYIHNNPVKAGIVKNIKEYQYSSYNEFINKKEIINEQSLKLLFGSSKDYIDLFFILHDNYNDEEFMDIKEQNIAEYIEEIEMQYNNKIREIIKDRETMKNIIIKARKQTNVTLVELANILDVSKSTVAKYDK